MASIAPTAVDASGGSMTPPHPYSTSTATTTTTTSTTTSSPGVSTVVGGVEEVSGMFFSPIATLQQQYEPPLGQRLLLFVRTNANCCLQGGVETILKLQKSKLVQKLPSSGSLNSSTSTSDYPYSTESGGDELDSQYSGRSSPYQQTNGGNAAGDPFAFLHDTPTSEDNTNTTNSNRGKSPTRSGGGGGANIGRFLKKVAKQTTASLERGMQELAIKADQGRNPDLLTVALFASQTGELLAMSDSVPLPRISTGVSFAIPLALPQRIPESSQVTLKLFLNSQASLMYSSASSSSKGKVKYFTLGQLQLSVKQMRQLIAQQRKGFFSLPLASNLVADGQIQFCVVPDLKLPALGQRGWSLIDPHFNGFTSSGLFNPPLDQSYLMNTSSAAFRGMEQHQGDQWLVATERAIESTVVLPLATAYARLCAQACHVSLSHSQAIASHLLAKRTEQKDPGTCARVQVNLVCLKMEANSTTAATVAPVSLVWQPPDSIFELELIPNIPVPVCQPSQPPPPPAPASNDPPTLQFFPPVCTTGILPAILKAYGGRLPPTGYMLGNLRMQFNMPGPNRQQPEVWEATVVLEQLVRPPQQQPPLQQPMQFPVYSLKNGQKVGIIVASCDVQLEAPAMALPQLLSPKQGLVGLVGMENLVEGVSPMVDFDDVPFAQKQHVPQENVEEMRRRHQQLATMGNFMSFAYLDQHIRLRRQADSELFQERAQQYQKALRRNDAANRAAAGEVLESWQDKSPRPFRPSSSRSEVLLSGIPFNTHNASLSLDIVEPSNNANPQLNGALFHNITCGAPSDHASGFGNVFLDKAFTSPIGAVSGGLRRLEAKRYELAQVVRSAQSQLIAGVANFFQTARQQQQYLNHVPARHSSLQNLRWKVFEAVHAYHHVTWICAVRRASAFSQALGIAVTSYLTSVSDTAKCQLGWPELWARHGYLVSFEGLLSAAGKELGMIEDASVAISMLRMVRIILVPDDGATKDASRVAVPHSPLLKWVHLQPNLNGAHTEYMLRIGIHPQYFDQRVPACLKNGTAVQLYPVLFQVGVDIRQWGAHAGSNMKNQFATSEGGGGGGSGRGGLLDDEDDDVGVSDDDVLVALNYEALQKMNAYAHLISPVQGSAASGNPFEAHIQSGQHTAASEKQELNKMSVHASLEMLHSHIITSAGKMNHSILDEAAMMAQQLGGGGVVFCKSGKDRTAMHVTYKQAQFANRFRQERYKSNEVVDTTLEDATRMRIHGTRLPICEKNVGQALYAFNALQAKFMPDALKPPPSTLAGFLKGGRLFSGEGIES